ncbi:hypothetical protein GJU40_13750 [Bacillus lacus]|uniref:Uncharacterized protein n=1 Tax=Metabacillus lacus TaxID=1983721 RepID=A0A7X2LZQ2_9BACI|nr:hypothetical protein [Metabacillus lacus]MRX73208.1 hypothetical protein [Metabacillus lacus]
MLDEIAEKVSVSRQTRLFIADARTSALKMINREIKRNTMQQFRTLSIRFTNRRQRRINRQQRRLSSY